MSDFAAPTGARPMPRLSISSTSTAGNQTGSWKYIQPAYHDRVAPCSAGCPTGVDIPAYMVALRAGELGAATELLLRENPMPAITGRVCNHPCESVCNRRAFDGAVSIHAVERMLGDRILDGPFPTAVPPRYAERVAVIGSGPAGLGCAYHLARLGYAVEVFEQHALAGGMLRLGIPEYRLPRAVLDRQLACYEAMGIQLHTGRRIGPDIAWSRLSRDFAAMFVATGAHVSKLLPIEGVAGNERVLSGLDFLQAVNRGERPDVGRRVLVVGGGNTAIDCARTAIRLGTEVTAIVYRRTREEMPAIEEEVEDAQREGVEFVFLAAPAKVEPAAHGVTLVCEQMQLGAADEDGRRAPVASPGGPVELQADTIITAIGEDAELDLLPPEVRQVRLVQDNWGCSALENVFLGGDIAAETRTVATALGSGKRAAIGIDRYLQMCRGEFPAEWDGSLDIGGQGALSMVRWIGTDQVSRVEPVNEVVAPEDINTSYFEPVGRYEDHHEALVRSFSETNSGLSERAALAEAARCFECGLCNKCELCQIYCSEVAIQLDRSTGQFVVDLDHCKGCGICAEECPRGAIMMEHVGAGAGVRL